MFADAHDQLQSPTRSKVSFHLSDLFADPEYQDNPLALVIYQPPLLANPQMAAAQPTFPFLIPPW